MDTPKQPPGRGRRFRLHRDEVAQLNVLARGLGFTPTRDQHGVTLAPYVVMLQSLLSGQSSLIAVSSQDRNACIRHLFQGASAVVEPGDANALAAVAQQLQQAAAREAAQPPQKTGES